VKRLFKTLIIVIAFAAPPGFAAEEYPVRPIRFIVPMPAGGALDAAARILGTNLAEILRQPIVIDNRSGAQGNVATALGARAAPDGYTMTLGFAGSLAINPHLYSNPGYDTFKNFAAVSRTVEIPYILIVNPTLPVKTMKDLELLAKQNPGKLTFASSSSASQLSGELFKLTTGTNMVHVPYSGAAPASIALVAGEVDTIFTLAPAVLPFIQTGKLRAVTVLSNKRSDAMPDVPTAVEAGYPALSNVYEWHVIVVPALTPRATIVKLNAAIVRALNSPDLLKRIHSIGLIAAPSTPAEFAEYIRADFERWGKIVKLSGAKVD
jgi:tripartite-type tricarboxylate transporter receptor subunit TctC